MALVDYLDPEIIKEAGTNWEEISAIEKDFKNKAVSYEQDVQAVSNILLKASGVHSVRYRIKDSTHLMEKVVRKRYADKTRLITPDNYEQEITDLAGVRVLHLFKSDWQRVHRFITSTWEMHEKPTAYFREGDSEAILEMYRNQDCEVKQHLAGYRSVHYIIKTSLTRAKRLIEVQVRTLFEEGWSEVDHKLRYPSFSDNPLTNNLLLILNRLAGSADEMSSFVQELQRHLATSQREVERLKRDHEEQIKNLQAVIDSTNISAQQRLTLEGVSRALSDPQMILKINELEKIVKDTFPSLRESWPNSELVINSVSAG